MKMSLIILMKKLCEKMEMKISFKIIILKFYKQIKFKFYIKLNQINTLFTSIPG